MKNREINRKEIETQIEDLKLKIEALFEEEENQGSTGESVNIPFSGRTGELLDKIPLMLLIFNKNGECVTVNEDWRKSTGLRFESPDSAWKKSVHADDFRRMQNLIIESTSNNTGFQDELRVKTFQDEYKWFFFRMAPVTENADYFLAVNFQIQQRKQSESTLENFTNKLIIENETKDKLFAVTAEKLRMPVQSFIDIISALENDIQYLDTLELSQVIAILKENSLLLRNHLENISDFADLQMDRIDLKKDSFFLIDAVEETIYEIHQPFQEKKISLENKAQKEIRCFADKRFVKKILKNLLSNSVKFSEKGAKTVIASFEMPDFAEVTIQDEGIGMTEEQIENAFNPLKNFGYTGTVGEPGAGLGLIVSRRIAEKQGGALYLSSKPNIGTKVSFTVPLEKKTRRGRQNN